MITNKQNNFLKELKKILLLIFCIIQLQVFSSTTYPFACFPTTLNLNINSTNPTCGQNNGRIIAVATAGIAPYTYTVNGGASQPDGNFLYLAPGNYLIEAIDATGAVTSGSITLVNMFTSPTASIIPPITLSGCTNYGGSITIGASGGTAPYLYSMDRINFQSSNFFPNLTAGEYHFYVKDANGCFSTYDPIANNIGMIGGCSMWENGTGISYTCSPFIGKIEFIGIEGGTPPYQFSMDGIHYQSTSLFTNLPAGIHKVWVKDFSGLIFYHSTTLIDWCSSAFSINAIVQQAHCNLDGSITVTAEEGTAPYQYSIDGTLFQSSNQFTGLPPGNYTVTVKDSDGLVCRKFVVIKNSCLVVTANPINSTCGNNNGKIDIHAVDGIEPYLYSIDGTNFFSTNIFTDLAAATYTAYVKDITGEIKSTIVIIENAAGPEIISVMSTSSNCTANTGTITINTQGGTLPLAYSNDGITFQGSSLFTAVESGSYTITVKDVNGCVVLSNASVGINNIISLEAGSDQSICEGKIASLNAISNADQISWTPANYLTDPGSLQTMASPPATIKYYLTATTGICTKTDSLTIAVKPSPNAGAGTDKTICFGKNEMLHGTGGVSYEWRPATYLDNTGIQNPTVINPATGSITYSLSVVGGNGCNSINNAVVTINVTPEAKIFAGNDTSVLINTSITLNPSDVNHSGFNQYYWSPTQGLNNSSYKNPTALITDNITYLVEAITPHGCKAIDSIEIKIFDHADIYVPAAFTPNGDTRNDILRAHPVGIKYFQYFMVYDRFGNKIFHTTNAQNGWDGKIRSQPAGIGAYVWIASGLDYQNRPLRRKGTILLLK